MRAFPLAGSGAREANVFKRLRTPLRSLPSRGTLFRTRPRGSSTEGEPGATPPATAAEPTRAPLLGVLATAPAPSLGPPPDSPSDFNGTVLDRQAPPGPNKRLALHSADRHCPPQLHGRTRHVIGTGQKFRELSLNLSLSPSSRLERPTSRFNFRSLGDATSCDEGAHEHDGDREAHGHSSWGRIASASGNDTT